MLHSYPEVYQLGHKIVSNVLDGNVLVEEKVDGSQISFGIDENGILSVRSKKVDINTDKPDGMFKKAVEWIVSNQSSLYPNWVYRGEYLLKPKHNTLEYYRVPHNHIIIFDICDLS